VRRKVRAASGPYLIHQELRACCLDMLTVGLTALALSLLIPSSRADEKSDYSRWDKVIAAFERQDLAKPPPKNAILFVGSSSIRLWDLSKSFPDTDVINRGFGGSQLADSVHFAPRLVLKHQPRTVVLYAGDNDIGAGKTPEKVAADFQDFARIIRAGLPKAKVIFMSIKPSILRWKLWDKMQRTNALIEAHCKREGLAYVDVASPMLGKDGKPRPELFALDGLHLNEKGYALWTSILKPQLS
jgi:lysophospholipase L1-like esterase